MNIVVNLLVIFLVPCIASTLLVPAAINNRTIATEDRSKRSTDYFTSKLYADRDHAGFRDLHAAHAYTFLTELSHDVSRLTGGKEGKGGKDYAAFVRGLVKDIEFILIKGTRYGVMVFDLSVGYTERISDMLVYKSIHYYDKTFGVWIYKCGQFINHGHHNTETWGFSQTCYWITTGVVNFEEYTCSDPKWTHVSRCSGSEE